MTEDDKVNLTDLAAEVRGLRADLGAYRDVISSVLARRLHVLTAVAAIVVACVLVMFLGSVMFLQHEASRSDRTLAQAQAESCLIARSVQSQVLAIVNSLPPTTDRDFAEASVAILSVNPCPTIAGRQPGG